MKKIALYLVLLLGLGIYAACDGGGDNDNDKCSERHNPITLNINQAQTITDTAPFIKSFVFTTGATVTDYTLQFHTKTNVFQWFLLEYVSTCYDDYDSDNDTLAYDYRNTDDPETIEFDNVDEDRLKANTKYFLRIKASTTDEIKFTVELTD